jgi:hypothetical protein
MSRGTRKARSGGPLPSQETLIHAYKGDARLDRELVDTERSVAETALLGERLFGRDVAITRANRWIEIITIVLREGVMSQDALYHELQRGSRATISRDVRELVGLRLVFRPEFEGASRRVKWIAIDPWGRHRFYVANEKTHASADPVREVRELRRRRRAQAGRQRRARHVINCMDLDRSSASDGAPARDGLGSDLYGWRPEDRLRRAGRGVGDTCSPLVLLIRCSRARLHIPSSRRGRSGVVPPAGALALAPCEIAAV